VSFVFFAFSWLKSVSVRGKKPRFFSLFLFSALRPEIFLQNLAHIAFGQIFPEFNLLGTYVFVRFGIRPQLFPSIPQLHQPLVRHPIYLILPACITSFQVLSLLLSRFGLPFQDSEMFNRADNVFRFTFRRLAASVIVSPRGFMTSSRKTSPG